MTAQVIPFPRERRSPPPRAIRLGDRVRYHHSAKVGSVDGVVTAVFDSLILPPRVRVQSRFGARILHPDRLTPIPPGGPGTTDGDAA